MILTDREIQICLKQQLVFIEPSPVLDAYSSTSVDLTLGNVFSVWKKKPGALIRPGAPGFKYPSFVDDQDRTEADTFVIKPQMFVLAWSKEVVKIPIHSRLAARVEGKSTLARLGICVHLTAPIIHCGFAGNIQLEMYNSSPNEIMLDAGMKICQLIFEQTMGTPEKGYSGMFLGQSSAGFSQ